MRKDLKRLVCYGMENNKKTLKRNKLILLNFLKSGYWNFLLAFYLPNNNFQLIAKEFSWLLHPSKRMMIF